MHPAGTEGVGVPVFDRTAALDVNFEADKAWWNGVLYDTIDAFVAAAGGSRSGYQITIPSTDPTVYIVSEQTSYILPSTPSEDQYAWYLGDGTYANFTRLRHRFDNSQLNAGSVRNTSTTLASITLATWGKGNYSKVAYSANAQHYRGALVGRFSGAPDIGSSSLPTTTELRIGSGPAGANAWTGKIWRVTVYAAPNDGAAAVLARSAPAWQVLTNGDSYERGAAATTGLGGALAEIGVRVRSIGAGGTTLATQDGQLATELATDPPMGGVRRSLCPYIARGWNPETVPCEAAISGPRIANRCAPP